MADAKSQMRTTVKAGVESATVDMKPWGSDEEGGGRGSGSKGEGIKGGYIIPRTTKRSDGGYSEVERNMLPTQGR